MTTFDISTPEAWADTLRALCDYRRRAGLRQSDVARRMGTSQSQVSYFERGFVDPQISTVARYMCAIGLRPDFGAVPPDAPERIVRTHRAEARRRD